METSESKLMLMVGRPDEWAYFQATYPEILKHVPRAVALAERATRVEVDLGPPVSS